MHKLLFSTKNPWKTSFFVITFALFLFVAISGAITIFGSTTLFLFSLMFFFIPGLAF